MLKFTHSTNICLALCYVSGERDTPMDTHSPILMILPVCWERYALIDDPTNQYKITKVWRTKRGTAVRRKSVLWGGT